MRVHHTHYDPEHVNLVNPSLYILYAYCLLLSFFSSSYFLFQKCNMLFKLAFSQWLYRNLILFNFELAKDICGMHCLFLLSYIYSKLFLYHISSFSSSDKYHLGILEIDKSQVPSKRYKVLIFAKLLQNGLWIIWWFFRTWITCRNRGFWVDNGNNIARFLFYA